MQCNVCPCFVKSSGDRRADVTARPGNDRSLSRKVQQFVHRWSRHESNTTVGVVDAHVAALIKFYALRPLPVEATLYASTWVSSHPSSDGSPAGTAIVGLYSVDPPSRSLFHRLAHDEVWHFYEGDPLRLWLLHPDGSHGEVILGVDIAVGQRHQFVVPAGTWQAGELVPGGSYALFGCTMAPGFTGDIFSGGQHGELLAWYPACADLIDRLGVPDRDASEMPLGFTQ